MYLVLIQICDGSWPSTYYLSTCIPSYRRLLSMLLELSPLRCSELHRALVARSDGAGLVPVYQGVLGGYAPREGPLTLSQSEGNRGGHMCTHTHSTSIPMEMQIFTRPKNSFECESCISGSPFSHCLSRALSCQILKILLHRLRQPKAQESESSMSGSAAR